METLSYCQLMERCLAAEARVAEVTAENVALVEAMESEKRICATWRKTAESTSEKLEKAQQCITELKSGKVGNALLERENHHVEVVGKLTERIVELAAENVALKLAIPEPRNVEFDNDSMDDVSLAEDVGFNDAIGQMKINISKTPATDRIVAGIKADAVEEVLKIMGGFSSDECGDSVYFDVQDFAKQLRESAK